MGRNQVRPSRGSWSDWIGIEDRIRWNLKTAARNLSNSVAVHSIPLLCLSLCVSLCVSVWKCDDRIDDTQQQQQQQQQQEEDEETVSVFKVGCRIRWDSCGILTGSLRDLYGILTGHWKSTGPWSWFICNQLSNSLFISCYIIYQVVP